MSNLFPIELLKADSGTIEGSPGDYTIEIPLVRFVLDDNEIDTSIVLEGVSLPALDEPGIVGRRFEFPVDQEEGSIDASVYIEHAHHPVDVRAITFVAMSDEQYTARLEMRLLLEYEGLGDYEDTDVEITADLLRT